MTELKTGDSIHGFTVQSVNKIPEYKGVGIRLIHDLTGADLYHLHNDDKENLFSFAFKTPAFDNSGVAHIIEHCVLAGSERYPIKDPFLSMMNGSMNTFLNAMTYPDKTVFPAASTVRRDYFNLMSVYADAVFFPLLREEIFMQEGIRFEPLEDGGAEPSGVVFNEMKGAYSNHDSIAAEYSYRFMFPDTAYRFDSGGEPAAIPSLSYGAFKAYHKRYYHPSNCRIFLYGDIETPAQLEFLNNEFLSKFDGPSMPAEEIAFQKDWSTPMVEGVTSPLSPGGDDTGVTLTLNWKCGHTEDSLRILESEVLTEALMGNMGAPLYKAVVESGIGEDLSPVSGLDTDLRELVFSIGVRGSSLDRREEFDRLIMDELSRLADEGIPELALKGALHRVEFRNREIKGGSPFGLRLMGRSLKGWLHGGSPEDTIFFKKPMSELRERLAENPRYFEELISSRLIENNHRLSLSIEPHIEHNQNIDKQISAAVTEARKDYTDEDLAAEKQKFEDFKKFQDTADPEELLARIPSLDIRDVPTDIRKINTELSSINDVPLYKHDLFTNGIIYIDFAIDIRDISGYEGLLMPFFSRMICSSGLPGIPYDQVALELAYKTGGLYTFLESSRTVAGVEERKDYLFFRLKTLESDLDQAFQLLSDMILKSELSDEARVRDLLFEMRNDFKSSIVPAGHSYCGVYAASEYDNVLEREDEWRGCRQFLFLNDLTDKAEQSIPRVCSVLEQIRKKLIVKERLIFNITASGTAFGAVEKLLEGFIEKLDQGKPVSGEYGLYSKKTPAFKLGALSVPSSVFFTARVFPASYIDTDAHAYESLLAHIMKTNDLWEEVRMKNGAYGVYASVNPAEGLMSVSTYRDPNPGKNLNAIENSLKAAAEGRYTENDLKKAIITVVGRDLKPMSPAEQSLIGFRRELYRITDKIRERKRRVILNTTADDLKTAAGNLIERLDSSVTVVMGPSDMIEEIAEQHGSEIRDNTVILPM